MAFGSTLIHKNQDDLHLQDCSEDEKWNLLDTASLREILDAEHRLKLNLMMAASSEPIKVLHDKLRKKNRMINDLIVANKQYQKDFKKLDAELRHCKSQLATKSQLSGFALDGLGISGAKNFEKVNTGNKYVRLGDKMVIGTNFAVIPAATIHPVHGNAIQEHTTAAAPMNVQATKLSMFKNLILNLVHKIQRQKQDIAGKSAKIAELQATIKNLTSQSNPMPSAVPVHVDLATEEVVTTATEPPPLTQLTGLLTSMATDCESGLAQLAKN